MKPVSLIGILLVSLGVLALAYQGITGWGPFAKTLQQTAFPRLDW